jgi:uncharacterized protein (TIGR00369 family)
MEPEEPGPLDDRHLRDIEERIANSPFHTWFGLRLLSIGDGRTEVTVDLTPNHHNMQGIVHGGVISTLADTAIGLAVRSMLPTGMTHRTAQLSVNYLAKVEGGRLLGRGRAIHTGRQMGYGEADIVREDGKLVARANATFIVMPAPGAVSPS